MIKFKKGYILNVVSITVGIVFLCNTTLYSYPVSKYALRVPVGQSEDRILGAMHEGDRRFNAFKRFIERESRRLGYDVLERYRREQEGNMTSRDRTNIRDILSEIGFTSNQIEAMVDKIILCEVPEGIRLESKVKLKDEREIPRIGGLLVSTPEGQKILFPRDRLNASLTPYMADLVHDIVELYYREKFVADGDDPEIATDRAHELAIEAWDHYNKTEQIELPGDFVAVVSDLRAVDLPLAALHRRTEDLSEIAQSRRKPQKILFIHFRSAPDDKSQLGTIDKEDSAGTDGVSLQMVESKAILEEMGHEVKVCSALPWADFPMSSLEYDDEDKGDAVMWKRNLFSEMMDFDSENELRKAFQEAVSEMKQEFYRLIEKTKPDMIFAHNLFSLLVHPVATVALAELLEENIGIICKAKLYDVLNEGAYEFKPTCAFAQSILDIYYPPRLCNVRYVVINSYNKRWLLEERGIVAEVEPDAFDFGKELDLEEQRELRQTLRERYDIRPNDLVVYVGTRITPNKQIEIAGQLTSTLESMRDRLIGRTLYNGETFFRESRIVLVIAGRPERSFLDYKESLFSKLNGGIDWVYVGDIVGPLRDEERGRYSLYDTYPIADIVAFPSGHEGFGNQALEPVYYLKLVAITEYLVFKQDIAPTGVEVISLGDKSAIEEIDSNGLVSVEQDYIDEAAFRIIDIVTDPDEYRRIVEENYDICKREFGRDTRRKHLEEMVEGPYTQAHELFVKIRSSDREFQVSPVARDRLNEVDFNMNVPIFFARDILANPVGFIQSWQNFGQPDINILIQNEVEREQVSRLKTRGFVPQGVGFILAEELSGKLKRKQGILLGFKNSISVDLPGDIERFPFAELQPGEVLNWERAFMLLSYRLGIRVKCIRLPQQRPFTEAYLGRLMAGEYFDITDIPVGVGVSKDIHKAYQSFRDTVGGL